jgi:predicted TIM-barrel fold metal-dependent hydrolase
MIDRWLERGDDRLYGTVLTATDLPEQAAEIRRVGAHPRLAAVLICSNGIGLSLGHPAFDPISLLACGTFERFPELRIAFVEGGVGWLPWLLSRLDAMPPQLRREVSSLRRLPSEYVR